MDETDSGTAPERDPITAEAARQWAEQQRAKARSQFATPSWIGPDRDSATAPQIPEQPEPDHDDLEDVVPVESGPPIPATAHWAETARPRVLAGSILVVTLVGVVTSLVLTITTEAAVAIVALAASAIVAVIFRGALMAAPITTVDLKGSMLEIRRGAEADLVDLADALHVADLVGTPDQPTWLLRLTCVDGRIVELGPKVVDAAEVHRIVEHYRRVAERTHRDREARFNR